MKEKEAGIEIKGAGPYLFILPIVIGVGIFGFGCFAYVLYLSFTRTTLFSPPEWVGLKNYFDLLFENKWFWVSLLHTSYYALWSVPLGFIVSLGIALAVHRKIKGGTIFRAIYLLPWISSGVIIALIFRYAFNSEWGIVNWFLELLGFEKVMWTGSMKIAIPVVATMGAWQGMGFGMIIFLGAIGAVPKYIYQAAILEGTNKLQMLRYITLPLIKMTIFFYLVVSAIGAFQVFDSIYAFIEGAQLASVGGIDFGTPMLVSAYFTYLIAFRTLRFGSASAMALCLFFVVLAVILIQRHFWGRKVVRY